jgi:hypothetical protein
MVSSQLNFTCLPLDCLEVIIRVVIHSIVGEVLPTHFFHYHEENEANETLLRIRGINRETRCVISEGTFLHISARLLNTDCIGPAPPYPSRVLPSYVRMLWIRGLITSLPKLQQGLEVLYLDHTGYNGELVLPDGIRVVSLYESGKIDNCSTTMNIPPSLMEAEVPWTHVNMVALLRSLAWTEFSSGRIAMLFRRPEPRREVICAPPAKRPRVF